MDYYDEYMKYKQNFHDMLTDLVGGAKKHVKPVVDKQKFLIKLIDKNDVDGVKDLLKKHKLNINHKDKDGNTALHYAVSESPELVEFLLDKGANVNANDSEEHTPLHVAIAAKTNTNKKLKIISILFEHGAKVNKANKDGNTALHFAIKYNEPEVVKALLGEDANKKFKNDLDQTPLDLAKKYFKKDSSYKKIIKLLDPNYKGKEKYDEYIIVTSPTSPASTYGTCSQKFSTFITEYFQYDSSTILSLMKYEGYPINLMIRCVDKQTYERNVSMGMQTNYSIEWHQKNDFWDNYARKLDKRWKGQDLTLAQGQCWSEPVIDLYLLFLIITARDLIRDGQLSICTKNYVVPGEPWIEHPKNRVTIEPSYNININDGSDHANTKIRKTFENIIKMLINSNPRSTIKYRSNMGSYMPTEFIYTY